MPTRVLLVLALACVVFASDEANAGVAVGGVVLGTDRVPIVYANVVILGARLGAQTDTTGTFRFPSVEPGMYEFRAFALRFDPVTRWFPVYADSTEPCTLTVNGPGRRVRESNPMPDTLWKALGHVVGGQPFRLHPEYPWRNPPLNGAEPSIGPYQILRRGRDLTRSEAARIGALLRDEGHYWHPFVGDKKLCIPKFRHGLRLATDRGDEIECTVCLSCAILTLYLDAGQVTWGGDFDPMAKEVERLFDQAFPGASAEK